MSQLVVAAKYDNLRGGCGALWGGVWKCIRGGGRKFFSKLIRYEVGDGSTIWF